MKDDELKQDVERALQEGYHAFKDGLLMEDNPYMEDTEYYHSWNTGFYQAEDKEHGYE